MLVSHPSKGVDFPARLLTNINTMEILNQKSVSSIPSETFKGPRILGNVWGNLSLFYYFHYNSFCASTNT
eukprot:c28026_g1_i2 orf=684-893(+)